MIKLVYNWVMWNVFNGNPDKHQCTYVFNKNNEWVNTKYTCGYACQKTKGHFGKHSIKTIR